jgi:hypothetical protein
LDLGVEGLWKHAWPPPGGDEVWRPVQAGGALLTVAVEELHADPVSLGTKAARANFVAPAAGQAQRNWMAPVSFVRRGKFAPPLPAVADGSAFEVWQGAARVQLVQNFRQVNA